MYHPYIGVVGGVAMVFVAAAAAADSVGVVVLWGDLEERWREQSHLYSLKYLVSVCLEISRPISSQVKSLVRWTCLGVIVFLH
jgi:hypothetical protein